MIACITVIVDAAGTAAAVGAVVAATAAAVHSRKTRRIVERERQLEAMRAALRRAGHDPRPK